MAIWLMLGSALCIACACIARAHELTFCVLCQHKRTVTYNNNTLSFWTGRKPTGTCPVILSGSRSLWLLFHTQQDCWDSTNTHFTSGRSPIPNRSDYRPSSLQRGKLPTICKQEFKTHCTAGHKYSTFHSFYYVELLLHNLRSRSYTRFSSASRRVTPL